jgi:predicted ATPase
MMLSLQLDLFLINKNTFPKIIVETTNTPVQQTNIWLEYFAIHGDHIKLTAFNV